jgi:3-hydroxyisobutyrate dehydrogenase-like beta-hydroxyacid dehydrogenase
MAFFPQEQEAIVAKLGFIGLGIMGYPMARNLLQAGHEVALWSHTRAKAEKLAAEHGGVVCGSPKEVGAAAECTFLCVGDTAMSEQVILGEDGIAAGAAADSVIVDASTVSVASSRKITATLAEKGIHFLGAPCTGSKPGAEGGTLTFMIGGDQVFERPALTSSRWASSSTTAAARAWVCTPSSDAEPDPLQPVAGVQRGVGARTKAGVDPELMLDILNNSAAKSGLIAFKAPTSSPDFSTNFSVKWMHKDIGLMLESAAKELDVPLPLTG